MYVVSGFSRTVRDARTHEQDWARRRDGARDRDGAGVRRAGFLGPAGPADNVNEGTLNAVDSNDAANFTCKAR